jgi:hypothetical protein
MKWYDLLTFAVVGLLLTPWAMCFVVQVRQFLVDWDF